MASTLLHEFHFVLNRGMKNKLLSLDMSGSLSGIIVKVLKLMGPVLNKRHKWGEQRKSKYMPVCDNPDEIRDRVHVYFPHYMYRQLKLMHQDLNVYSIAQLLREMLNFFIELVNEYGDNIYKKLKKIYRQWNKEDKCLRLTSHEFLQQLSYILRHLPGHDRLINIYNCQYSPFWTLRL